MKLIAFSGKAGSGKDTAGEVLVQQYGFRTYAFADPVREVAKIMFNLRDVDFRRPLKDTVIKRLGVSPRFILQKIGTEVARQIHKDVWVMKAKQVWEEVNSGVYGDDCHGLVITDCRFDNEASWVRKEYGSVVHVVRAGAGLKEGGGHVSEDGIKYMGEEYILTNSKGLHEFIDYVEDWWRINGDVLGDI